MSDKLAGFNNFAQRFSKASREVCNILQLRLDGSRLLSQLVY